MEARRPPNRANPCCTLNLHGTTWISIPFSPHTEHFPILLRNEAEAKTPHPVRLVPNVRMVDSCNAKDPVLSLQFISFVLDRESGEQWVSGGRVQHLCVTDA